MVYSILKKTLYDGHISPPSQESQNNQVFYLTQQIIGPEWVSVWIV